MAPRDSSEVYRFDVFQLDPVRGAVLGPDGAELRLRPKTFALLRHLLDNPGRLLRREELLDALWPGVVVTDDSVTQCLSNLRHALGDRAAHVLRTIPKRGYILAAEVRRDDPPRPEPALPSVPVSDVAALRDDPVAIHRFGTPDGERACVLLAEALATDLIAAGTRIEGMRILPASDAVPDEGYRVRGEVRAVGVELRVTLWLEDAATGAALWAHQLDQLRDGPPGLPGATLLALSAHLNRQVARQSLAAARRKPLAALSARELVLIGRDHHQRGTKEDTLVAKEMFARAIAADPNYAQAYAWQAYTVHRAITHGWGNPEGQEARDEALRLARRAVQLQPESTLCLARLAFALVLHQRWEEAVAAARSALSSERPAFALTRNTSCEVLAHAGHPEEAAAVARGTIALEPLCPPTTYALLGRALLLAGQVEEALPALRTCGSRLPDYAPTYDSLVVATVETGRVPEALAARRELFRLRPRWAPRNHTGLWYFRRDEDVDRFQAAHRRAAELAGAAGRQGATPDAEPSVPVAIFVADRALSPTAAPVSRPTDTQNLAALRQEALVVHALQPAPDDAAAARAASAITSGLMAELVRYEDLRVVARPENPVAHGFAVRGDVYSAGEQLCARVRLDDLETGTALWAQRLDWPSSQGGDVPSESIAALAGAIDLQIGRANLRRAREKSPSALTAHELNALAREHYARSTEAETAAARQMFARAAAVDPGYAPAHAGQSFAFARTVIHEWQGSTRRDLVVERAVRLARRAVELEPESPLCLVSLALSLALQEHWDEAVDLAHLALRTNRVASDRARTAAGSVLTAAGYPAEAEEALRSIITRDAHCSPYVRMFRGRALLQGSRLNEALRELRRGLAQLPDYALGYRTMVVASIEAGLVEEACEAFRQVARLRPEWADGTEPIFWFLRKQDDRERCQRAFQMAMRLDAAAKAGELLKASTSRA